jgi:hypothetical protein
VTKAVAALAAVVAFLADGAAAEIGPSRLALMPLPKQSLGPGAALLPLDPGSGVVTNAEMADDSSPGVTAATFNRLGRITGYTLDYNDAGGRAFAAGRGLLEVETSVEVYRSSAAARAGIAFRKRDDAKLGTLKLSGLSLKVTPTASPQLGDERYAYEVRATIRGKPPFYGAEVVVRAGTLVATTSVTAVDRASLRPLTTTLAKRLQARVAGVLAGTVSGPPVPLPAKLRAGPPPNGPELSALALKPADLGRAAVTRQGYQLDKDLNPISEYARELSPAGDFAWLSEEVALFHSRTEASFTVSFLESALKTPGFLQAVSGKELKQAQIRSFTPAPVAIRAGDESRGVVAKVVLNDGRRVEEGFILVRIGRTTEFIVVVGSIGEPLRPSALGGLARTAARRANVGLDKR